MRLAGVSLPGLTRRVLALLVIGPGTLGQVSHPEPFGARYFSDTSDETPILISERTNRVVPETNPFSDIGSYQVTHGGVVWRTRVERAPEVAKHVVPEKVGEDED